MKENLSILINFMYLLVLMACGILGYALFGESLQREYAKTVINIDGLQETAELRNAIAQSKMDYDKVENGIHIYTGLAYDENFSLIRTMCTSCHSAKLITQNRATRQGWADMIDWMQETQGLGDLGTNEIVILDYLEEHYAPKQIGRRANIDVEEISWYILQQ